MSRRLRRIRSLLVTVWLLVGVNYARASITASGVGCPEMSVTSLDRSITFFTSVLGFRLVPEEKTAESTYPLPSPLSGERARTAHLILGEECLDLAEYSSPRGNPFPVDSHGNDRWFQHIAIVVSDMSKAYTRLRAARVAFVSNEPQTLPDWKKEAAGISAFYFRDPDGHYLELIHFPPGKGQAKWQAPSSAVFLGIDHTAIVVANTAASLHFYRDSLHFHIVGGSENYGSEQEHLSGVFNAHVVITSLRSSSGIGIELLEYLSPGSGRPIPQTLRDNDIASWHSRIEANAATSHSDDANLRWVKLSANSEGYREAAWIRDPDGHSLEIVRK